MKTQRRILLCITGLSPQVVTETCFALAQQQWFPDAIHIITTLTGAAEVSRDLLARPNGWFHKLCTDHQLPAIDFSESNVHVIHDRNGAPLADIRSKSDNEDAADAICEIVRAITESTNTELHVSIAGGRKTMGYHLGYALSLFGREQDRLSHVLVSSPFENSREFFYPTPYSMPVTLRQGNETVTLDAHDAEITLADIPFVRLRHGLPTEILQGHARFSQSIHAAQTTFADPRLVIDHSQRRIKAGDNTLSLPPAQIAFLAWFARQKMQRQTPLLLNKRDSKAYATAFLQEYKIAAANTGKSESTIKRLKDGMEGDMFSELQSKLHRSLNTALGERRAQHYKIQNAGKRGSKTFELALEPQQISFARLA